jgi:hypothetical protein
MDQVVLLKAQIREAMQEVDKLTTPSAYDGGDDTHDRAPDGDDYNRLWDAVIALLN